MFQFYVRWQPKPVNISNIEVSQTYAQLTVNYIGKMIKNCLYIQDTTYPHVWVQTAHAFKICENRNS